MHSDGHETKGSAAELEARRRQAVALLQDGKSNTEVARLVGADLSSVKRWKRAVAVGCLIALAAKPNRGRSPKIAPTQRQELAEILRAGPLAAGFRTNLWTCRRVLTSRGQLQANPLTCSIQLPPVNPHG